MSAKKPEQYRPTRASLLLELEALRTSLSPDELVTMPMKEEPSETNPVLKDADMDKIPPEEDDLELVDEEDSAYANDEPVAQAPTLGQQSLFAPSSESNTPKTAPVAAKGENPFLPQHIRERLSQNKNSILEELAHVGESLSKYDHRHKPGDAAPDGTLPATEVLIDELVAKYLPQIEQELRARLKQQLKK